MKAWKVWAGDCPQDSGVFLVFAETKNKARLIGHSEFWDLEYIDIQAVREKEFDKYFNGKTCLSNNNDLPEGISYYTSLE